MNAAAPERPTPTAAVVATDSTLAAALEADRLQRKEIIDSLQPDAGGAGMPVLALIEIIISYFKPFRGTASVN